MTEILQKAIKTKYVAEAYATFSMQPLELTGDALAVRAANLGPAKWRHGPTRRSPE
jgi:hypothetical protein